MLNYLVVGSLLFHCYYHSLLALAIDIKLINMCWAVVVAQWKSIRLIIRGSLLGIMGIRT